jgi:N-acetyl-alpha-D-muramate 1-phosphate uridylyltransferase
MAPKKSSATAFSPADLPTAAMKSDYKAMIFAAGRGERMRPLTDAIPKPLLAVGGRRLIEYQLTALAQAGFAEIVINTAWLGAQFAPALGDGRQYGLSIAYSHEGEALETVGGIVKALPLLGAAPFITTSGDVYTDFDYARLRPSLARIARGEIDAHFVLADNPPFHPEGDFAIQQGLARRAGQKLNFSGIACWQPKLFADFAVGEKRKLFPWANALIDAGRVSAEHHPGIWENIGTPQQLAALGRKIGV